jgi:hypothetical protein
MAFTPVPTVAAGDLWTAAQHNTFIKNNFAAEPPAGFTAKSQLRVGSGSATTGVFTATNYPWGSIVADSAQALGIACYPYAPGAVIGAGSGTIADGGVNQVVSTFAANWYDWGGLEDAGHTFMQIPPGYAGTYLISIGGLWAAHATPLKWRQIGARCSVAGDFLVGNVQAVDVVGTYQSTSALVNLVDGETVKFIAAQFSGAPLGISTCWLAIARIQ